MSNEASTFQERVSEVMARVYTLVRACPSGRVTTYGWIGKALGYPRGASMVGMIMNESPRGVPAQRVINSQGELSGSWAFETPEKMRQLLEAEGIVFSAQGRVDLKRYGWDPSRDLDAQALQELLDSASALNVGASPQLLSRLRRHPASPFREVPDEQA